MKKTFFALLTVFYACIHHAQSIDASEIKQHISYLASDKLNGRGTGTKDELKAAQYVSEEFNKLKLKPFNGQYIKKFQFKRAKSPHDTSTSNVKEEEANNVVAFLDNKAPYTIVIGAHYDHLGLGKDHNSLDANPEGKIHNGADDNASGTAGVLALAKYFVKNKTIEPYNFLFICFSGEEL